jgi:ABC-type uncharacterized transport system substrate-binding protein
MLLVKIYKRAFWLRPLLLFLLLSCTGAGIVSATDRHKVLVVFSYEEDSLWELEIRKELERVLGAKSDLTFFYLETKVKLEKGSEKAAEAYGLYLELAPDGVVAVDDNAQSLFVVPYLKNKTAVPVVFCGVNADPEDYGYPTSYITGVLERHHFEETLAFNRLISGKIDKFALMVNRSPSADLLIRQLEKVKDRLSVQDITIFQPETLEDAVTQVKAYHNQGDLLLLLTLKGLTDKNGHPVDEPVAISEVVAAFDKPTAATAEFVVRNGVLSGVVATGKEQGMRAGEMLLKAMEGIPVSELPVQRNYLGKRVLNVTTMTDLGIDPEWMTIRGVDLVCSE